MAARIGSAPDRAAGQRLHRCCRSSRNGSALTGLDEQAQLAVRSLHFCTVAANPLQPSASSQAEALLKPA